MSTLHHIPLPPIRTTTEHSRPTRISLCNGQANDDLIPKSEWSQVFHYGDHEPRTVEQTESCYNNDHSHSDKRGWLVGDGWLEMKVNHTFPCLHEMWFHSTNGHYTLLIRSKTIDRWRLTKQLHPRTRPNRTPAVYKHPGGGRENKSSNQSRSYPIAIATTIRPVHPPGQNGHDCKTRGSWCSSFGLLAYWLLSPKDFVWIISTETIITIGGIIKSVNPSTTPFHRPSPFQARIGNIVARLLNTLPPLTHLARFSIVLRTVDTWQDKIIIQVLRPFSSSSHLNES